jgi:hypothetical protein
MKNKSKKVGVEGEGSYTATRNFDKKQQRFVSKHRADIRKTGKAAEDALHGLEGDTLRKAEDAAKSKARG